jgi:hypothetical protein
MKKKNLNFTTHFHTFLLMSARNVNLEGLNLEFIIFTER